jgi:hypothetical protein
MKIGTWLLGMVRPLVGRLLVALGFSVVSIVGFEAAFGAVKNLVVGNLNSVPASIINLALYLWLGKGLGIVFGAMTTKLALWQLSNSTRILGKGNG